MSRGAVIFLALLCGCARTTPSVKYYDFSTLASPEARNSETGSVIRVERFRTPPGLGGTEISMRWTDFHIESYRYHRWSTSSTDLVTELVADALAGAGRFRRVDIDTVRDDADVVLSGRILRFEGVGGPNGSVARVSIAFTARRSGSEAILLSRRFDQEVKVREHSVLGLVRAFHEAVVVIADDLGVALAAFPDTEDRDEQLTRAK